MRALQVLLQLLLWKSMDFMIAIPDNYERFVSEENVVLTVSLEMKHLAQRFGTKQVDKVPKSTMLIFLALALHQSEYWHISLRDKSVNEIQAHFLVMIQASDHKQKCSQLLKRLICSNTVCKCMQLIFTHSLNWESRDSFNYVSVTENSVKLLFEIKSNPDLE